MDNPKIQVVDRASGETRAVDPGTAEADFRAGKVGLTPGTTVPVALNGTVADMPVEKLADALQNVPGLALANKQDILGHDANTTGGQLRAAAEGATRALTFGASDLLARAAGADPEAMAARARTEAAGLGEGLGTAGQIAATFATGGLSAAAGGAEGIGARTLQMALKPAQLVDALGAATAQRVESSLTGAGLSAVASKAIGYGVAGTVQGAVVGGLQGMSEASLGNPELNAEVLLSAAAEGARGGALWGGLAGVGLGAVAGKLGASKAIPISETPEELGGLLRREGVDTSTANMSFADRAFKWLGGVFTNGAERDLAKVNNRTAMRVLAEGESAINEASTKMAATLDEVKAVSKELDDFSTASRARLVRDEIPEAAGDAAAVQAHSTLGAVRKVLDGIEADSEMLGLGPKGGQQVGAKIRAAVDDADDRIFKAAGVPKQYTAMEQVGVDSVGMPVMAQVTKTRTLEDLAGLYDNPHKVAVAVHDAQDSLRTVLEASLKGKTPEVTERLQGALTGVKSALKDGSVWGDAARVHELLDAAQAKRSEMGDYLDKAFRSETSGKIMPDSVKAHVGGILNVETDGATSKIREFARTNQDLMRTLHAAGADVSALRGAQSRIEKFTRQVDALEKPIKERVGVFNAARRLARGRQQAMAGASNVMSYALGSAIHDATGLSGAPLGLAAAGAFTALTDPARIAVNRARIGAAIDRRMVQVRESVHKLVTGEAPKTLARTGGRLTAQIQTGKTYQERADAFRKRIAEVQYAASPLGAKDHEDAVKDFADAAPAHADALAAKRDIATRMLLSAIPAPIPTPGGLGLRPPMYTDSVMRRFARMDKAIQDPESIVHDAMNGKVTHEARQVLHTIYPQLALTIQDQLVQAMDSDTFKMSSVRENAIKQLLTPVTQNDMQRVTQLQSIITAPVSTGGGKGLSDAPTVDAMTPQEKLLQ